MIRVIAGVSIAFIVATLAGCEQTTLQLEPNYSNGYARQSKLSYDQSGNLLQTENCTWVESDLELQCRIENGVDYYVPTTSYQYDSDGKLLSIAEASHTYQDETQQLLLKTETFDTQFSYIDWKKSEVSITGAETRYSGEQTTTKQIFAETIQYVWSDGAIDQVLYFDETSDDSSTPISSTNVRVQDDRILYAEDAAGTLERDVWDVRKDYSYNADMQLERKTISRWDTALNDWAPDRWYQYSYDENGNFSVITETDYASGETLERTVFSWQKVETPVQNVSLSTGRQSL